MVFAGGGLLTLKKHRRPWSLELLLVLTFSTIGVVRPYSFDYNDISSYCNQAKSDHALGWVCFFSLEPTITCREAGPSGSFHIVQTQRDVKELSSNRFAFINISECSSLLPNRLPVDLLAGFDNFIIGVGAENRHAHDCPDIHVLSTTFTRLSHQAKCLVLINISQELLENTLNLDRFDLLKEFVLLNSTLTALTPVLYSFIQSSAIEKLIIHNTDLDNFEITYRNFNQSLSQIDLAGNKLSRFEIDANTSLTRAVSVNVSNNKLFLSPRYLRFNHQVTEVDLSFCGLLSLQDFYGQMHMLNLSHNRISELHNSTFAHIDALAVLDLSYNALTALPDYPLGAHLSLIELNLSHNKIDQLPDRVFGNSTLLARLDLSFNNLVNISRTSLNFSRLPMLQYLNLNNNKLISFPSIEPFSQILTIILGSNRLSSLSVLPTKFNSQISVVARNNSISDYRSINTGMYASVVEIDHLMWDPSFLPPWVSSTAKKVISVDVSANNIKSLDAHVLMANFLIKPFHHFGVVSFYNMSENPLECSCELLNRVRYLIESFNVSSEHKIDIVARQVSSILKMNCSLKQAAVTSSIPLIELANESRRRQLKCSDNQHRCPDECFCYLDKKSKQRKADCAECDCLHELPYTLPPNTSVVNLGTNFIKVLGCKPYLRDVKQLDLSNNMIERVEECVYWYLRNVEFLNLAANHIVKFPYKMAYLKSLTLNESVILTNNSFSCECSDDVRDAFDHFGGRLQYPEGIECHTEDGLAYQYLHYLEFCDSPDELHSASKLPSGVQSLILVAMSAIAAVIIIIAAIVLYYLCCSKYFEVARRNWSKIVQRFTGSNHNHRASICCNNQGCFRRLQRFRFSPLRPDSEIIIENDELDAEFGSGRQLNCESAPL